MSTHSRIPAPPPDVSRCASRACGSLPGLASRWRRRPQVEELEDRSTPAFGDLLYTIPNPGPTAGALFGTSVSLSGNSVLVSHPNINAASRFDVGTGGMAASIPTPLVVILTEVGSSPSAMSGNVVVIGKPLADPGAVNDTGRVGLYNPTGGALRIIDNPFPGAGDQFGLSVAISGNVVAMGAPFSDFGGIDAGMVYLVDAVAGTPPQAIVNPAPAVAAGDLFGASVAVSGNFVVVGAPFNDTWAPLAGQAYLFDAQTGALLRTFANPFPAANDGFGWSVAVTGNLVLVGAPWDDTGAVDAGSAYLFDAITGGLLHTINNPAPGMNDGFGWSVAVSASQALVGVPFDNAGPTMPDAGSAYLFSTGSGGLLNTFTNPTPAASDGFGWGVALSGSRALVGTPGDDTGAVDAGSAYLFDVMPNPPSLPPTAPAPARQGVFAVLRRIRRGRTRRLEVHVYSARTGALLVPFRCPYQEPAYSRIQVLALDTNGDGLGDTVEVLARRGTRRVARFYAFPL